MMSLFSGPLSSRDLSRTMKLILYITLILLVLLRSDAMAPDVHEKKFRPVCVGDDFHIRTNKELYDFLNDMSIVHGGSINLQRMRWFGRVVQREENVKARRVFDGGISGRR